MKQYGGLPCEYTEFETSAVVVLPVPYDGTSTWNKGADRGPEAIIEASANMELYDIETDSEVFTIGIHTAEPVLINNSPEAMAEEVYQRIINLLEQEKFVVTLGGEHSISIGAVRAFAEKIDNLTVLQLDAHSDMRNEYEGSSYNHACVMARVLEYCPAVQLGIRSMDISERDKIDPNKVFYAKDLRDNDLWMHRAINQLSENVYLTIDLDVFDPSIMPSTGTPEPGGMLWYETLEFLTKVFQTCNVVGFDVVELCPNNINKAPDFMASKLIYKLLSLKFAD